MASLETELFIPRPRHEVFPFFADAFNLERITPPWLHFRILTSPPIHMRRGLVIDYTLRLHRWPIRWQSEITRWEPPARFVDEQRLGPYRRWLHEHSFVERDGGTVVRDRVDYEVPGGRLVDRALVRRDLDRIFAFRRRAVARILARP